LVDKPLDFLLGWYLYLSYTGNQFCDCQKTEKYQEGSSRTSGEELFIDIITNKKLNRYGIY
jgi:hypothetical protein